WENAVDASGEMVTLLLFAYVIRCFVEYFASNRDAWLLRGAFVYGLAMTNDWSLTVFLPLLVVGLIWVKGFFSLSRMQVEQMLERRIRVNVALLWQLPACWVAGLLLVFLLPTVAAFSKTGH